MKLRFVRIFVVFVTLFFIWSYASRAITAKFRSQTPTAILANVAKTTNVDIKHLPIGDGRVAVQPKTGYVWSCRTRFRSTAGAHASGDWIQADGTYNLTAKPTVDGTVRWPSQFKITQQNDLRTITSNRLPKSVTGNFPISPKDDAYAYDRNPNSIKAQAYQITLPAMPEVAQESSCLPMGAIGVLLNGGYFFNALDERGEDAVAHEIQDSCQGHPEKGGAYHYHSLTSCLEAQCKEHSALVGYAFDGFGIYGHCGENGKILTNADLDSCHGHTHEITWDGKKQRLYHYHATWEYPYTVGCYRGKPNTVQITRR